MILVLKLVAADGTTDGGHAAREIHFGMDVPRAHGHGLRTVLARGKDVSLINVFANLVGEHGFPQILVLFQ